MRRGLIEPGGPRPFEGLSDEDLTLLASYDPTGEPALGEPPDGVAPITFKPSRPRSTPRRRLEAEDMGPELGDGEPTEDGGSQRKEPRAPRRRAEAKPPRKTVARAPLSEGLGYGLMGAGLLLQRGADPPVGRAIQWEAPLAAEKLDALVAGTVVDRLLQPVARAGATAKELGAVLALPLLVALIERRPELAPYLEAPVKSVLTELALDMAELGQRQQERLAKMQKRAGAEKVDVEGIMAAIFGWERPPQQRPEAASAAPEGEPSSVAG